MLRRNIYTYAGLVVALVLPVMLSLFKLTFCTNLIANLLIKECVIWTLFLIVLAIAKYGEQEPIEFTTNNMSMRSTIGRSIIIVLSIFVFGMFYGIIYLLVMKTHPPHESIVDQLKKFPLWLKLFVAIRAGIVEETLFRAYGMTRIKRLTNNNALAFIIPLLFFAVGHYSYGTLNHIVGAFFIGAILATYYLNSKNLIANIIAHFLFDLIALTARSV